MVDPPEADRWLMEDIIVREFWSSGKANTKG
jgi:hypothetical protein